MEEGMGENEGRMESRGERGERGEEEKGEWRGIRVVKKQLDGGVGANKGSVPLTLALLNLLQGKV